MDDIARRTRPVFQGFPQVKLAYLFGSRASDSAGPLSDYDFAVYIDEADPGKALDVELDLQDRLRRALQTDAVDVLALHRTESPELKYNAIARGLLIHEVEPFAVLIEPKILNEYFDFRAVLRRHGLTQS